MIIKDGSETLVCCDHCGQDRGKLITCLFGVVLCKECDDAIVRKNVPKKDPTHPRMKAFLKRVESGHGKTPFTGKITKPDGKTILLPFKHTAASLKKCGMNR